MYSVYVLYSEAYDKIYIGYTTNLEQRFLSHNELGTKGWTPRYRPWKIVLIESYATKLEAMTREKKLKGGQGRQWIRDVIITKK
jgi:putative endonuclease